MILFDEVLITPELEEKKNESQYSSSKRKEANLDDITLDDKQHDEMNQIVTSIEESASCELEAIFKESECQGAQLISTLCQAWKKDTQASHEVAQKIFFRDQQKNSKFSVAVMKTIS